MTSKYTTARRWHLVRSVLVFQLKLIVDGLRDLLLVPVSMVAGVMDLAQGRSTHNGSFREVLIWGRRTERWIDLFGLVEHKDVPGDAGRFDALVDQLEKAVREQVRKGGVTAAARDSIDRLLNDAQREAASVNQAFWAERYATDATHWDRGEASPALGHWDLPQALKGKRVLVPGCGRGWEVDVLAESGARVIAVDLVAAALEELDARLKGRDLDAELRLADVLEAEIDPPVDAVYEQTCLCALDPADRAAYESRLARWIKPGGRLFALFMQTDGGKGPPWHCDLDEMRELFSVDRWQWPEEPPLEIDHPSGLVELGVVLTRR